MTTTKTTKTTKTKTLPAKKTAKKAVQAAPVETFEEEMENGNGVEPAQEAINEAWETYLASMDAVEEAQNAVQEALQGLKAHGNQFEVQGELKQVRSRPRKDGTLEYYIVHLKSSPAEWMAAAKEKRFAAVKEEFAERLRADFMKVEGIDQKTFEKALRQTLRKVEPEAGAKKPSTRPEGDVVIG